MAEKRTAFRVEGRVQGVGFRWWTRQVAGSLGLRGTVRNCPDGTVEVRVAGDVTAVERLRSALAEGPSGALVRNVTELPSVGAELPENFRIVR